MKTLVFGAGLMVLAAQPAAATLQLSINVGGSIDNFFDNGPGDTNPALGVLQIGDQTIDGAVVNGSIQASTHGGLNTLTASSLSIINDNATTVPVTVQVSDTGYGLAGPSATFGIAGSGTWLSALGSSIGLGWFVDGANGQGAPGTPGTEIGTFSNSPASITDSFSHSANIAFATASPFSMSLSASGELTPGAELINRGQSIVVPGIPEPKTWVMLIVGFGLMALAGFRRKARLASL